MRPTITARGTTHGDRSRIEWVSASTTRQPRRRHAACAEPGQFHQPCSPPTAFQGGIEPFGKCGDPHFLGSCISYHIQHRPGQSSFHGNSHSAVSNWRALTWASFTVGWNAPFGPETQKRRNYLVPSSSRLVATRDTNGIRSMAMNAVYKPPRWFRFRLPL